MIKMNRPSGFPPFSPRPLSWILCLLMLPALTACFTGVEGTKKIALSRKDKTLVRLTPEDEFLEPMHTVPLGEWKPGKQFMAADNRTLLVFDPEGLPTDPDSFPLKGKTLTYRATEPRRMPDGSDMAVLLFECDGIPLRYPTGKNLAEAPSQLTSDQLPLLIDLDLVAKADSLLRGKMMWTRSPLWYGADGSRVTGLKFVPVTVSAVTPGSLEFPLRVEFTDARGNAAALMMNFGFRKNESRAFPKIFSLSSPRDRYPAVSDSHWDLICRSKVTTGMTKAECKLALGNPGDAVSGRDYTQTLDLWQYPDGTVLWFEDGLLARFKN